MDFKEVVNKKHKWNLCYNKISQNTITSNSLFCWPIPWKNLLFHQCPKSVRHRWNYHTNNDLQKDFFLICRRIPKHRVRRISHLFLSLKTVKWVFLPRWQSKRCLSIEFYPKSTCACIKLTKQLKGKTISQCSSEKIHV